MRGSNKFITMKGFDSVEVVEDDSPIVNKTIEEKEEIIVAKGWESYNEKCASGIVVKDYGMTRDNIGMVIKGMKLDAVNSEMGKAAQNAVNNIFMKRGAAYGGVAGGLAGAASPTGEDDLRTNLKQRAKNALVGAAGGSALGASVGRATGHVWNKNTKNLAKEWDKHAKAQLEHSSKYDGEILNPKLDELAKRGSAIESSGTRVIPGAGGVLAGSIYAGTNKNKKD